MPDSVPVIGRARGVPSVVLAFGHGHLGLTLAAVTADLVAAVRYHHEPQNAPQYRALLALVSLSDLLCRMGNIGHGYVEERQVNLLEEPAFALLLKECPALETFDWARFTFELESYLDEVQRLEFRDGRLNTDPLKTNDFALFYYPDIGMTLSSIMLANQRLAPIQVCGM